MEGGHNFEFRFSDESVEILLTASDRLAIKENVASLESSPSH